MKIAIIGQKVITSISEELKSNVEDLSVRLVQAGHEVLAYTRPNYPIKIWRAQGVQLISLPSLLQASGRNHHTFRACLDVAKRDVDVIHFHSIGPSSLIWLVKLLNPHTPVIATFHCQDYLHQKWEFSPNFI